MKTVRLENNTVVEVVPFYALPLEDWWPESFAAQCVEGPDEVEQGWRYDSENGAFTPPGPDTESIRSETLSTLSTSGNIAITSGVTVTLPSTGDSEHFSLQETDQINLTTALTAVEQGAAGYPYHADGQLCRLYSAADIMAISQAAVAHKLYHTTYCNHLLMWARRAETVEELAAITYGADLPEDLAANMAAVLEAVDG